jgi:drug/metabolite transporter (DMT)-like permease
VRSSWKNDIALLSVVLIWGVNFPVIKVPLEVMPPFAANVFRFTTSVLFLGAYYAAQAGGDLFAPMRTHGKRIVALGLLGHVAYQVCFITGVHWTTAGSAALIMAASPLWTAVASQLRGYERLPPAAWGGLLVSLAGTGLVVVAGANLAGGTLAGNLLMLAASVFWGLYTAFNIEVVKDVSPAGFAFLSILVALPVLVALGVPTFGAIEWSRVGFTEWAALIFSGGFSTGVAYIIWAAAVRNVGPSSTAVYANLVPFVALLGGMLLLGESITFAQVLGGVLIIGGLVALRRSRQHTTAGA